MQYKKKLCEGQKRVTGKVSQRNLLQKVRVNLKNKIIRN